MKYVERNSMLDRYSIYTFAQLNSVVEAQALLTAFIHRSLLLGWPGLKLVLNYL